MYYIEVESGVKIMVEDINPCGAKTILFIHGWPLNHKMFEYQINVLPKYGYRCVLINLRGFGASDKPWEGYSYERLADDVRVVIDHINVEHLILAGYSMGGAIAVKYMSRHAGHKVSKLALLAAAVPAVTRHPGYPYGVSKETWNALIIETYKDRPQMLADVSKLFFANPVSSSFLSWFQDICLEASGHATIKTGEVIRDADLSADLNRIYVPTGIFHGRMDRVCLFELALQTHKGIACSTLYPFEHSGHGIFHDELKLFNKTFLEFLEVPEREERCKEKSVDLDFFKVF